MKVKIFSALFVIFIIIIWRLNILSIDKIRVINLAECVNSEDLNRELNSLDKKWMLIDPNKLKIKLTSKFQCIKSVDVSYEFPKTVLVSIYSRKFLAKVVSANFPLNLSNSESTPSSEAALLDWNFPAESSEDAFVIDDTGFIFTKVKPDYLLPTIFLSEKINLGTKLNSQSFNIIDQIFSKILQIVSISYQPNFKAKKYGNTLLINASPKLAFSLDKDILKQLASLQLILQKAKIDERVAEFIDLRFDKPVVQYRMKSSK